MSRSPRTRLSPVATDPDIPMPPMHGGKLKYQWTTMEVGHSFLFPEYIGPDSAASQAHLAGKKYGRKFSVRRTADGFRCWRLS